MVGCAREFALEPRAKSGQVIAESVVDEIADSRVGSLADVVFVEAEVVVIDVGALSADFADDVVVVR